MSGLNNSDRFSAHRWQGRPTALPVVELFIGPKLDADIVRNSAEDHVYRICGRMGIPYSEIAVLPDPSLGDFEFAIVLSGCTRFVGQAQLPLLDWLLSYPVPGQSGRAGLVDPIEVDAASIVARAVEQALWEDPSLLWTRAATAEMQEHWSESSELTQENADDVHAILSELIGRRIPLTDADRLWEAVSGVGLDAGRCRIVEQLSSELSPAHIEITLGEGLEDVLDHGELAAALTSCRERLFERFAIAFPKVSVEIDAYGVPERTFGVLINDLPRATGVIPADRICLQLLEPPEPDDENALPTVHPVTGIAYHWVTPGDSWFPTDELSSMQYVLAHLEASLIEAAAEFADLAWIRRLLDRCAESRETLVEWVRKHYSDEILAAVGRGLVGAGVSLRFLPLWLERLLEFDHVPPAQVINPVDAEDVITWSAEDPRALIEYARSGLKPQLTQKYRAKTSGRIQAMVLAPALETALRGSVQRQGGVYGAARGPASRALLQAVRDRPAGVKDLPIVTALDLRAPVQRLLAAQFPAMVVLSRTDLAAGVLEPQHTIGQV